MRLNCGSAAHHVRRAYVADAEVGEAGDPDVLAGLRRQLLAQLLDRLRVVFLGVDVGLIKERDLARPLRELALDDFLDDVVGLAFLAGLLLEDASLGLALLRVDFVDRDVLRGAVAATCSATS